MSDLSDGSERIEEILRQILGSAGQADQALDDRDVEKLRLAVSGIRTGAQELLAAQEALTGRLRKVEAAAMERIFGTA